MPTCTSAVWSCRAAMWKGIHPMNDILTFLSVELSILLASSSCGWMGERNLESIIIFTYFGNTLVVGLGGHVFSVYALYLSLINALLLSAVIHTSEQRWGLTQRASGFLLWFQGPKGLGCASSGLCRAGAGRCSKKNTHQNQRLSICVPTTPAQLFWKSSPCFHRALRNKRKFKVVFFSRTIVALIFPRWKLAIQMQSSHGGQRGVSLTSYVAHPSHRSLP